MKKLLSLALVVMMAASVSALPVQDKCKKDCGKKECKKECAKNCDKKSCEKQKA